MPPQSVPMPTAIPEKNTTRRWTLVGSLFVAGVAIAFGWPTRNGGSIAGDDERLALNHVLVNHPSLTNAARLLTIVHSDLYQPLPVLTFQLNYALAEPRPASTYGVSLYGFHLANILLHAVNAMLVFLVASRLASCRRVGLLTALMFACHPFAVEPVAWISGRTILLATLFSLLLLLALALRQNSDRGVISIVVWLLSLASKVLPTVPIAAIWCDRQLHGPIPKRRRSVYAILVLLSAAATYLVYRATSQAGFIEAMEAEPADPMPIRVLLAARYYLENYFWPSRLAGWSPPPLGNSFSSPMVLIAIGEWIALFAIFAISWRRHRIVCLGLGLFLILIAPFLAASVARRFLAADRYMYLPILGLHLAVAAALVAACDALRQRSSQWIALLSTGLPATAILIAWFCVGWRLSPTWANNVTRNQRACDVYHGNVLAHVELAKAYVIEKQPNAALETIDKARQRWPEHPRLAGVAGEAYRMKKKWSAAEKELRRAAEGLPHHLWTHYYLARTLDDMGRAEEARRLYEQILQQQSEYLPALLALARSHEKAGDIGAAVASYERAIGINPNDRDSLSSLAVLRIRQMDWTRAEPLIRTLLALEPDDASALLNLGVVLARTNRTTEALGIYDRLIAKDPDDLNARLNRASLLPSLGRAAEAESEYRAILGKQQGQVDAAIGLHELLQQQHRYQELPALWLSIANSNTAKDIRAWLVWALVLAGKADTAQRLATTFTATAPGRAFSDWAMAYGALRDRRIDDFKKIMDSLVPPRPIDGAVVQEAGIIRTALLDLPASTRESAVGLFALANALFYDGQTQAARAALDQILQREQSGPWAEAAKKLARTGPKTSTQPTATAPHPP